MTVQESKDILRKEGFPVNRSVFCLTCEEVRTATETIGFPCVLKIVSKDIVHKTEAGGVQKVYTPREIQEKCTQMIQKAREYSPGAEIQGFVVEEMIREGVEIIIGAIEDQSFGKTLMFGMGGVFVELYKDVSFRLIPIDRKDAVAMIGEVKASKLLDGYRGGERANKEALIDLLLMTSELVAGHPEIKEIDLNPVFVARDATIVDARIVLSTPGS
jgi:acyl-CoA synthetase (NDP forming)